MKQLIKIVVVAGIIGFILSLALVEIITHPKAEQGPVPELKHPEKKLDVNPEMNMTTRVVNAPLNDEPGKRTGVKKK